jgi:predicted nucleic acid-binding protein
MKIASNASALINLARIVKLDLLRALYGEIVIPEAVWQEVVVNGAGQPGSEEVKAATWIRKQVVTNRQLMHVLQQELGAGEAEAIALATEIKADLLLMDERLGRETAHHLGLRCIGLIGILIEARRKGFITAVKPHLDALRNMAGFRIKPELYLRVLQDEGEVS